MTEYWQWGNINVSNYQNEFQEGFIENTPDAGIPFKRLKFTDIQEIVQATFTVSESDYTNFLSWYKFNIKQGELSFQFYDSRYEKYRTTKIVGKPTYTPNSNMFNITVKLTFKNDNEG